jgi:hypothetical protein
MAGNANSGRKADALIGSALRVAALRVIEGEPDGRSSLVVAAEALVAKARAGDIFAFKEMADRIDGKPKQQLDHTADDTISQLLIGWLGERAKSNGHAANGSANGHAGGDDTVPTEGAV